MRVKLWICIANLHIAFFTAKWKCLFFEICVTQWDDLPKLYMSESFVVEQCVSCFREETSRCFMKNEPSFCGKWHVVLWKVTRRFVESDTSFYEKQAVVLWKVGKGGEGIGKRWKKKIEGGGDLIGEGRGVKIACWEMWNDECEKLLVRAYIHVYNRSFCVFAVTSVTVFGVTNWNIVE